MNSIKSYEVDAQKASLMNFQAEAALTPERLEFHSSDEALRSPLAAKLFGFPWVEAVILDQNQVQLQKADWVEWEDLADPLAQLISDHLGSDEPIYYSAEAMKQEAEQASFDWRVSVEQTPNPASLKFQANASFSDQTRQFDDPASAQGSPLAEKLFGFPWTESVFIGKDFVSVTKADWVQWDSLAEPLASLIEEHLVSNAPVMVALDETEENENDTDEIKAIKKVLNQEIRPAVAMDGGDVLFQRYEENVVYLYMRGACAGCPSSTMTLKMGIEQRLKEAVPSIKEVVAL